jgi:hypothetical protein
MEQSLLEQIQNIHEQVREFVESQRPCKVTRISGSSTTYYASPLSSRVTLETETALVNIMLVFQVEAVELKHYPGMRLSFRVEVVSDATLRNCTLMIANEHMG